MIYVDADACPVKKIIVMTAKKYNIPVTMVIDTSHELSDGYSTVVTVDKSVDSADFYILGKIQKNDILVTQDYGLASIALSKEAYVINQNGFIYDKNNIDRLLFERHINKQIRMSGKRHKGPKKRTKENDLAFEKSFISLVKKVLDSDKID